MHNRSIQSSLSWWLAIQTFCCLAATSAVIYAVAHYSFNQKQEAEIGRHQGMIQTLYNQASATQDWDGLRTELLSFFQTHNDLAVRLKRNEKVIFSSGPSEYAHSWKFEILTPPADAPELELRVGIEVDADREILKTLAIALIAVSISASMVVSLTGTRLVRKALAPLRALAKETSQIGPHLLGKRLTESAYGCEMTPFVRQFNHMLQRTEQAYHQLEAFNADVAHELRTPLANLIGEAEVELAKPRNAEELREVLMSNVEEARRLSTIVSDMLFLSRADRGVIARAVHAETLSFLTRDVIEFYEAVLESMDLKVKVIGDAEIAVDPGLIKRAISNLLDNAIRYSEAGTDIKIEIENKADETWVIVSNKGVAIPSATEAKVFERFYRADHSRTGANHGLGLAIVAAIARMHSGQTKAFSYLGTTTIGFSINNQLRKSVSTL